MNSTFFDQLVLQEWELWCHYDSSWYILVLHKTITDDLKSEQYNTGKLPLGIKPTRSIANNSLYLKIRGYFWPNCIDYYENYTKFCKYCILLSIVPTFFKENYDKIIACALYMYLKKGFKFTGYNSLKIVILRCTLYSYVRYTQ